jgi:hypothetical protein
MPTEISTGSLMYYREYEVLQNMSGELGEAHIIGEPV